MLAKHVQSWSRFLGVLLLLALLLAMVGCGTPPTPTPTATPIPPTATPIPPTATPKPPPTVTVNIPSVSQVEVGKSVAIVLKVEPYEKLDWRWKISTNTSGGQLTSTTGDSVVYIAGSKGGVDIVETEATTPSGVTLKQTVSLTVVAAPTAIPPTPVVPTRVPPTATLSVSTITLSNPQDGQTVKCQIIARGTYPLDLKEQIWPVVYINGVYHPQDEGGMAAQKDEKGNWFQTVRFGNCDQLDKDRGKPFTLIIVAANDSANAEFDQYLKTAKATNSWPGMPRLPQGAKEHVRISVTRE